MNLTHLNFDLPTILTLVVGVFAFTFVRYVLFSGLWYMVSYHWLREWFQPHKLNARYPDAKTILGELKLGTLNLVNFGIFAVVILWLQVKGYTQVYTEVERFGWGYLLASLAIVFVVQDAYFYWLHRLLHTRFFMKHVHGAHHRFRNPTPFAAFAVHPIEGAAEVAFRPLILCLLPLHPIAIGIYVVASFVINVFGHGGVEVLPRGSTRGLITGLFNTPTHHYQHHKYVVSNFSLYFTWWDKLCGTEQAAYHEEFDEKAISLTDLLPEVPAPAHELIASCSARISPLR